MNKENEMNEEVDKIKKIIDIIVNIKPDPEDIGQRLYFPLERELVKLDLRYSTITKYIKKYPEIFIMYGIGHDGYYVTYNGERVYELY